MKRSIRVLGLACVVAAGLCTTVALADNEAQQAPRESLSFALPSVENFAPPSEPWTGRVLGLLGPESIEQRRGVPGIPTFSRNVVARGRSYRFTMIGSDPFSKRSGKVVVPLQIIPIRMALNDGTILDPTLSLPACAGPGTPLTNVLESPLFIDKDYGEGPRQWVEENRLIEFWAVTGANPGYSVRVAPSVLPTVTLTFDGPSVALPCGRGAMIPLSSLFVYIQTTLLPELRKQGVSPRTFPVFLFSNVVFTDPKIPLLAGYHTAINLGGGVQTYGVAEYDTSHFYNAIPDIATLSHELAEWYDDPFVNNVTPPWGHAGQVAGCQANLEVGDPLTGSFFAIPMPNGLTYHPQELAFFSWFFNQAPSLGLNGFYSSAGTLTKPASPCR